MFSLGRLIHTVRETGMRSQKHNGSETAPWRRPRDPRVGGQCSTRLRSREHLLAQTLQVSESYQARIAREIEESICQHLAGTTICAESIAQNLAAGSSPDEAAAARLVGFLREAMDLSLALARRVSPRLKGADGLQRALHQMAQSTQALFHIHCHVHTSRAVRITDEAQKRHLYRIALAAVSDAIQRGFIRGIRIRLDSSADRAALRVERILLAVAPFPSRPDEAELSVMCFHARMLGGTLAIDSSRRGRDAVVLTWQLPTVGGKKRSSIAFRKDGGA